MDDVLEVIGGKAEEFLSPNLAAAHAKGVVLLWRSDHTQKYSWDWLRPSSDNISHKLFVGAPEAMNSNVIYVVGQFNVRTKNISALSSNKLEERRKHLIGELLQCGNDTSPLRRRSATWRTALKEPEQWRFSEQAAVVGPCAACGMRRPLTVCLQYAPQSRCMIGSRCFEKLNTARGLMVNPNVSQEQLDLAVSVIAEDEITSSVPIPNKFTN